jgi:hypothetical protein
MLRRRTRVSISQCYKPINDATEEEKDNFYLSRNTAHENVRQSDILMLRDRHDTAKVESYKAGKLIVQDTGTQLITFSAVKLDENHSWIEKISIVPI